MKTTTNEHSGNETQIENHETCNLILKIRKNEETLVNEKWKIWKIQKKLKEKENQEPKAGKHMSKHLLDVGLLFWKIDP